MWGHDYEDVGATMRKPLDMELLAEGTKGRFDILLHVEAHLCRKYGLADHGHNSVEMVVPNAMDLVKNKKMATMSITTLGMKHGGIPYLNPTLIPDVHP